VIRIPYDPALAAGSVIKFNELQKHTRDAARQLAAEVISSIINPL
jgi:MinD-like ATPase involved in chromosome partitioning or flagellar assembly